MKKITSFIFVFYIAFIFLMPKENLYFSVEKFLKQNNIIVSNEKTVDFWAFLDIRDGDLYYRELKIAHIKDTKAFVYLFFNAVLIKDIKASKEIKNLFDFRIDKIFVKNSIIKPFDIFIKGEGNIGKFDAVVDLDKKILKVVLQPDKKFQNNKTVREFFKKSKEGYIYEYSFK